MKREESYVRVNKWQGGKLTDQVYASSEFPFFLHLKVLDIDFYFLCRNGTVIVEQLSTWSLDT
jgi:hypothetical protein